MNHASYFRHVMDLECVERRPYDGYKMKYSTASLSLWPGDSMCPFTVVETDGVYYARL